MQLNKLTGKGSLVTENNVNTAMQCYQRGTQANSRKSQNINFVYRIYSYREPWTSSCLDRTLDLEQKHTPKIASFDFRPALHWLAYGAE